MSTIKGIGAVLLLGLVAVFAVIIHIGIQHTEAYRLAVDEAVTRYGVRRDEVSLCWYCTQRVNSKQATFFRLNLDLDHEGAPPRVCVAGHSRGGGYAYEIRSGVGPCTGSGP